MAGTPSDSEAKLMAYMVGWRTGAKGGLLPDGRAANADCARGFEDGRKACGDAYKLASDHYGTHLSILR